MRACEQPESRVTREFSLGAMRLQVNQLSSAQKAYDQSLAVRDQILKSR
jgi:hypothetical protein